MGARRGWPRRLAPVLVLWALLPLWLNAGEPGRLEEDAEFLLGSWASDCGIPGAARSSQRRSAPSGRSAAPCGTRWQHGVSRHIAGGNP